MAWVSPVTAASKPLLTHSPSLLPMLPSSLHPRFHGALRRRSGWPAGMCVQTTTRIGRAAHHRLLMDLPRLRLPGLKADMARLQLAMAALLLSILIGSPQPSLALAPATGPLHLPHCRIPPRSRFLPHLLRRYCVQVCGEDTNLGVQLLA